jgi:nicotinate-nucleotide adenylyltransferase
MGRRRMTVSLLAAPKATVAPRRSEQRQQRLGILGGTFDPPHVGHLWLAALAADSLGLDRVLFMPAAQPPHKGGRLVTRATDRLLMTRLAIAGDPTFELCPIEMERTGPSYTIDSVTELKRAYPDAQHFLVMASDSLAQIDTWREPDRLLAEVEWAVGPRSGSQRPDRSALEARFGANASRIHLLEGPTLEVSSSAIRRRVAAGLTIHYLVPRDVEELILLRRLYRRG